jgi:hypothetical protein
VSYCVNYYCNLIIVGKRWNFVPKRFRSPPREFKYLYGSEVRQTTMDNFVKITKRECPVVKREKKEKIYVQSNIKKYFVKSGKKVRFVAKRKDGKSYVQSNIKKYLKRKRR